MIPRECREPVFSTGSHDTVAEFREAVEAIVPSGWISSFAVDRAQEVPYELLVRRKQQGPHRKAQPVLDRCLARRC
jgi:hypothetical protein